MPTPARILLAAIALGALHGCGQLDELTSTGPQGTAPPAGFATDILSAHNAVRADVASVGGSPAPSPALAPLAWSDAVAATAQAWADGCVYAHNSGRGELGENIAATAPAGARTAAWIVQEGWAAEAPYYSYATNTCDTANPPNQFGTCGHYTQLVWRGTTVAGCAVRTCTTGSPWGSGSWDFWVCDYAPPGNWAGERPY